jgi:hypothetical protein
VCVFVWVYTDILTLTTMSPILYSVMLSWNDEKFEKAKRI